MSVTIRKHLEYALSCDQPGCGRRLTVDERTMWSDPDDFELDALRTNWQHDGDGRWYCPKHWHLICHYCGATAVGDPDRLADRRRAVRLPGLRGDALIRQTGKETDHGHA